MRLSLFMAVLAVLSLSACSGGGGQTSGTVAANAPGNTPAPQPQPSPGNAAPDDPQTPTLPQREADYISFEGGLKAFPREGRVELQVVLLGNQTRPLEFLLVAPGGATHESLFATGAKGEHLKRCLEMIQLKEAELKRSGRGYTEVPGGDKVKISVRFRHADNGTLMTVPVEEWLWDHQRNAAPEAGGWVFTGSFEQFNVDMNRSMIESDMKGNLIAMWRDSSCVIDNARPNGATPDIYSPNPKVEGIPASQSEVTLIFEAYKG